MARSRPSRLQWALSCLPVVLVLLCYRSTVDSPFVYDDYRTVLENRSLALPIDWGAVLHFDRFRPIVSLTYLADFLRSGKEPLAFHQTNILLHATNAVLVFWLTLALLSDLERQGLLGAAQEDPPANRKTRRRREVPSVRGNSLRGSIAALFVASVFAVHPLMTESVAYVTGRSESICGLFFLLALLGYRRDVLGPVRTRWRWRASWLLAWVAALGAKEVAVAFPFVAVTWDYCLLSEPDSSSSSGRESGFARRLKRVHLPMIGLTAAAGAIRIAGLLLQEVSVLQRPVLDNLYSQATVVWRYLGLLALPRGQSIVHPVAHRTSPWQGTTLLAIGGFALATWLAWRLRRTRPWWLIALVWFVFCLAPSSSLIPLTELMAEHRAYLASVGVLLALGAELAAQLMQRRASLPEGRWVAFAGALLVLVLGGLSVRRNRVWADPITLWTDAVERSERTAAAHLGLGIALQREGRCDEAIPSYERSIELEPDHPDTHINLGICLAETRQYEAAYRAFSRVVAIDPTHVRSYNNLAKLELMMGRVEDARSWLERGLELDDRNVITLMSLALIHERYDFDIDAALELCHRVRSLDPQTPGVEECIARNTARIGELRSPGTGGDS